MTTDQPMIIQKPNWLDRLRAVVPPEARETGYRVIAGVLMLLASFGFMEDQEAALWTQLGISVVTLVFALLYATSTVRIVLYAVTGPLGAVLMWYGLVSDTRWALIVPAVAQIFGVTTAAAKVVQSAGRHEKKE